MGKNIRSLQLLRNTALFTSKELAIAGIKGSATNDGTVKLARYSAGNEVKTVFGICYNPTDDTTSGATGFSYTIYDSPQEVITALEGRIKANEDAIGVLNGADTLSGSVAKSIKDAIAGLDATIDSTGGTFVDVQVVETDGKITAVNVTEYDIASAKLLGTSADTSGQTTAFGFIAKEAADRTTAITAAIDALDVDAIGGTGKVITTISETDGKISATAIDLTAGNVKATATDATDEKVAVEGTTVEAQVASLAKSIKTAVKDAKSYKIAAITGDSLTALGANVKEAYKLIDEDEKQAGEAIKIYKDSSLREVKLVGQELKFTYILADGNENTVGVDVSTFLAESEFKNGLEVVNHLVNVKIDAASEGFLTVGEGGVKLSGVQTAINTAANKAATEVVEDAAGHVTVTKTTGGKGQAIYTIGENDIASDAALTAEVTRAKAAEDKIEASVGLAADGSHIKATGSNYTSEATTVVGEIAALDTQVKANADAISANKTAIEASLASEVAARKAVDGQSGDTYAKNTGATYISGATSLNDADVKLDAATKAVADEGAKIVAGVGFTEVDGVYKISGRTGASVSADSTVKDAIYTLDNAIAAAKKANTLTKADETVVVTSNAEGTKVRVNITTATTVTNFVGYASDGSFIKSEMFGTIDAGTY